MRNDSRGTWQRACGDRVANTEFAEGGVKEAMEWVKKMI
jgi:hypothetical protein